MDENITETTLTAAQREALRFALIHYRPEYDEGSNAYVVVERIVAAARADERERIAQAIEAARDHYVPVTRWETLNEAARIAREGGK